MLKLIDKKIFTILCSKIFIHLDLWLTRYFELSGFRLARFYFCFSFSRKLVTHGGTRIYYRHPNSPPFSRIQILAAEIIKDEYLIFHRYDNQKQIFGSDFREFNPFKRNGISPSYQLDQYISFLRVVGWYLSFLFKSK